MGGGGGGWYGKILANVRKYDGTYRQVGGGCWIMMADVGKYKCN